MGRSIMKVASGLLLLSLISLGSSQDWTEDWCKDYETFFVSNCPTSVDSYTGCCLCTQYYYYSCSCCADIVDKFGVNADCSELRPEDLNPEEDRCFFEQSIANCTLPYMFHLHGKKY